MVVLTCFLAFFPIRLMSSMAERDMFHYAIAHDEYDYFHSTHTGIRLAKSGTVEMRNIEMHNDP